MRSSSRPGAHRTAIAAYIKDGRHVIAPGRAKRVAVIAQELAIDRGTVRRWLRADHYDEWMRYWPTVEELFAESAREREAQPPKPQPAKSPLAGLPDPEELLNGFDPDEDELNAQLFADYRQRRRGYK